jgi:predicted DNA-binding protein with PD1-like motif
MSRRKTMATNPPIVHPGPVASKRFTAASAAPVPLDFMLRPGETAEEGFARGVAEAGCDGGYVEIVEARFDPFNFVMPAPSPDAEHAAWYSRTFTPADGATVERAGAIVGRRDGRAFVHCHGVWRDGAGKMEAGHMLPMDSRIDGPARVLGTGLRGAVFESRHDPETNFRLFAAEPAGESQACGESALAVTLRPNQDITRALQGICGDAGIRKAAIHGVGSLNGASFEAGPKMDSFASEFFVSDGGVQGGFVRLEIAVVAIDGTIYRGWLVPDENPVCVTCELIIVAA